MDTYPKTREEWAAEAHRVDDLLFAERMKPRDKQRPFYMAELYQAQYVCKMAHDYCPPQRRADGVGPELDELVSSDLAVGARTIATDDTHRQPSPDLSLGPAKGKWIDVQLSGR